MKHLLILSSLLIGFIAACNTNRTRDYIPGTYINHAESEYSIADDTLVIEQLEKNHYIIYRKTGFKRLEAGKLGRPEYDTEEWQALYDEATSSLHEVSKGKFITFYPDANKLMVGKREYRKIN